MTERRSDSSIIGVKWADFLVLIFARVGTLSAMYPLHEDDGPKELFKCGVKVTPKA